MEREVTVWESSKQKKTVFTSNAENLGQLKEELLAHDVDLANMSILEGVSHTQLLSDESILPHDIPYRGTVTNNLMIYLTLQNKKVSSGIDRKEIGAWIKAEGLSDVLRAEYGDNWTRVSTDNLIKFYNKHHNAAQPEEETPATTAETTAQPAEAKAEEHKETPKDNKEPNLLAWAKAVTEFLYNQDITDYDENQELLGYLNGAEAPKEPEGGFSKDEINAMIGGF